MRNLVVALLLLTVTLAGCSDDSSETSTDECITHEHDGITESHGDCPAEETPQADGGNATQNQTAPNSPPTVNATLVTAEPTAGQQTSFWINVTDADGTTVTWSFDADGDGVADLNGTGNATAIFTYDANGTYNASVNATDGTDQASASIEVTVVAGEPPENPDAPEDRGEYIYDPATGLCHAKAYTTYGGAIYVSSFGGGTWVFAETNDVDGLQYENNHPLRDHPTPVGSFALDTPDCVNGDLTVI